MLYLIVIVSCVLLISIYFYNQLHAKRQSIIESWANIDVQLKRRHELIPNLVTAVYAYAKHEKETLETITRLRTKALTINQSDVAGKSTVEEQLGLAVQKLLAVAEQYPDLKANAGFLKLQEELVRTEDLIASSKRIYNNNVADYAVQLKSFPSGIIAALFQFPPYAYFEHNEGK